MDKGKGPVRRHLRRTLHQSHGDVNVKPPARHEVTDTPFRWSLAAASRDRRWRKMHRPNRWTSLKLTTAMGGMIIVTARRREERLLDVPIAATSISQAANARAVTCYQERVILLSPSFVVRPACSFVRLCLYRAGTPVNLACSFCWCCNRFTFASRSVSRASVFPVCSLPNLSVR